MNHSGTSDAEDPPRLPNRHGMLDRAAEITGLSFRGSQDSLDWAEYLLGETAFFLIGEQTVNPLDAEAVNLDPSTLGLDEARKLIADAGSSPAQVAASLTDTLLLFKIDGTLQQIALRTHCTLVQTSTLDTNLDQK